MVEYVRIVWNSLKLLSVLLKLKLIEDGIDRSKITTDMKAVYGTGIINIHRFRAIPDYQ